MALKIYTKTGDQGQTGLFGGQIVSKSDLRVRAYGSVDELNAFTGALYDQISLDAARELLFEVQHRLFSIGAHLAAGPEMPIPTDLRESDLLLLENAIDSMDAELPPLRNFILPGGHPQVSATHICRTVARRAEREVVALHLDHPIDPLVLKYLNRLSDYFFVLGRKIGQDLGIPEHIWKKRAD